MSEKYFGKFPLITYNNQLAVNITERVVVRDFPVNNAYLYYPYDVQNGERPDQLADRYLNDEYMSWIIYMSNGVTDPYYDWLIPDDVFNSYLKKKYGDDSLQYVINKVAYYRNNWYTDQDLITATEYNSLPDVVKLDAFGNTYISSTKRYYEPDSINGTLISYHRKKIDETLTTNKIVKYSITGNSHFTNNEIVEVVLGYANVSTNVFVSTVTGAGQVLASNSTTLTIQHTSGYVDTVATDYSFVTTGSYVYGSESSTNCAVTAFSSLANNISNTEAIYWSPVTIYEDEYEKNMKNKTIRMIDSSVAQGVADEAAKTLSGLL